MCLCVCACVCMPVGVCVCLCNCTCICMYVYISYPWVLKQLRNNNSSVVVSFPCTQDVGFSFFQSAESLWRLADSQFGAGNYHPGEYYHIRIKKIIQGLLELYQNVPDNSVNIVVLQAKSG